MESEKDSKEGRRKIIGRLFHEIRARSTRAKELFDGKLKTENPTAPEEISAFLKSARETFEKDNTQLQKEIEENGHIVSQPLAREFANLTFAIHPDVMNRDYAMEKKKQKQDKQETQGVQLKSLRELPRQNYDSFIEAGKLMDWIDIKAGQNVLEVGPLLEENAVAIAKRGAHYRAYSLNDLQFDRLELVFGRYDMSTYGGSATVKKGEFSSGRNSSSKDIRDGSQDFVLILSGALSDPFPESGGGEVFEEALRVIKPGGKIVIGTVGSMVFEREQARNTIGRIMSQAKWQGKVRIELMSEKKEYEIWQVVPKPDLNESVALNKSSFKTPPPGSIYGIFKYLCEHEITAKENAISGEELARLAGEEHEDRQEALSFESIKDDIRNLLLHLHLIEKAPGSETGKNARYYVPEAIKKKSAEILPLLEQFRGKSLRPTTDSLDIFYKEQIEPIVRTLTRNIMSVKEILKILPQEWYASDFTAAEFLEELARLLRIENILDLDKSAFIFSEKVTFDNGLGVFMPKLVKSGMKIAVIATNDTERALINELNQGKPEDERIVYGDTIADVMAKVHSARYYYFKVKGDPDANSEDVTTFDITDIVKKIIEALGKLSGIRDSETLELFYEAAREFAEAA